MSEEKLSPIKEKLMALSDEQIFSLLQNRGAEAAKKTNTQTTGKWFDTPLSGLDKQGEMMLQEMEEKLKSLSKHHVDQKLVRYLRQLKEMKMVVPDVYREDISAKELYRKMAAYCYEHDIPDAIVAELVPILVEHRETGRCRGVVLVGSPGCGKTTTVKMLLSDFLSIPTEVISVPQTAGSNGLFGDNGTYQNAESGSLQRARIKNNNLFEAYLFDEVDKVPGDTKGSKIIDQLLSLTDDTVTDMTDNYTQTKIIGLEHSLFFFCCNDQTQVNSIFLDRCQVIHFPNPDLERLNAISSKYAKSKLRETVNQGISLDDTLLNLYTEKLCQQGITSIRKHQQLIEQAIRNARNDLFQQESENTVQITDANFANAEKIILSGITVKRKAGF